MPSVNTSEWKEKAGGFFSSSGVKLKQAGQSAGTFVGGVAKDAKGNAADVVERVGSVVKSGLATTGTFLRKGMSETKEKVVVGKDKVEEFVKKTAQKYNTILTVERRQKEVASTDVFGVPIEVTVQRQQSSRIIPHILVRCAEYLDSSGLNSPWLFKSDGDKRVLQQLVSMYNQDANAPVPEGTNPVDIAALAKCYLASFPEPLVTLKLYNEIRSARTSITDLRNILKKLPNMDARSLAMEMTPIIMWQTDRRPEFYREYWDYHSENSSAKSSNNTSPTYSAWDMLSEESDDTDASSDIPLDDALPVDYSAIEVIQCLIEHHKEIFTDAN
ncbi:putative Rho GTPase-activating protein [Cucurbita argyrosperma subsp. argyrosperma]|nr:putative Rho GTPase-activating protein [Cucurbita argyrosperma subsp. argyrosperma]